MIIINNKIERTNVLTITIDGSFSKKDISKLVPILYNVEDDKLNLMVMLKDIDMSHSFAAIDDKLKAELLIFKKLRRCAVVTDKKWLQLIAKAENSFLPTMSIKTFEVNEQDQAMRWLQN